MHTRTLCPFLVVNHVTRRVAIVRAPSLFAARHAEATKAICALENVTAYEMRDGESEMDVIARGRDLLPLKEAG